MRRLLVASLILQGCTVSSGRVAVLSADPDVVGVKLLRPRVEGESCRASLFGVPLQAGDASIEEALAKVLALDTEGNVVTNVEVSSRGLVTGVYNRACIEVRGDLGRSISTIIVPVPGHERHVH